MREARNEAGKYFAAGYRMGLRVAVLTVREHLLTRAIVTRRDAVKVEEALTEQHDESAESYPHTLKLAECLGMERKRPRW